MQKKIIFFISFSFLFFTYCKQKNSTKKTHQITECITNWNDIKTKKTLTILAENSPTSFFIYKGKNMGFEYELLHEFAKDLDIRIKIKMMYNLDSMSLALNNCKGDLIACNLTITNQRKKHFLFTKPILTTHQVLIQRKPENWKNLSKSTLKDSLITEIEDLKNKKVFVWKNSTYFKQITKLNKLLNLNLSIIAVDGDITSEDLIRMVSEKEINYTITDANVAKINLRFYNNINIDLKISDDQQIALAGRLNSPEIINTFNNWLTDKNNKSTIGEVKRKYFDRHTHTKKAIHEYSTVNIEGQLSPYDIIIKEKSKELGWDWRLVSAIIYQESKFETYKTSWAGAYGLFQFMPSTASAYGLSRNSTEKAQLTAGIKKLNKNYNQWLQIIPDSLEAIYFTLATFNAGRGHIDDARALAKKYNYDENKWFNNVNEMILNLSKPKYYRDKVVKNGRMRGVETYKYVFEIFERYEEYKHAFPNKKE